MPAWRVRIALVTALLIAFLAAFPLDVLARGGSSSRFASGSSHRSTLRAAAARLSTRAAPGTGRVRSTETRMPPPNSSGPIPSRSAVNSAKAIISCD